MWIQVKVDLRGFDIGQQWMDDIERKDCITTDLEMGGALIMLNRVYKICIVDSVAGGWYVVYTF